MALSQRLELRQGQSLVMTPQLQQAIKLLQMSNMEVQAFVEQELERNPLLERDDTARSEATSEIASDTIAEQTGAEAAVSDLSSAMGDANKAIEQLETLGTDLTNVYADEARADADNRLPGTTADSGWSSLRTSSARSFGSQMGGTPNGMKRPG